MSPTERELTAYHESGHGAMSWLLGYPFEALSIRPGKQFAGCMVYLRRDPVDDLAGMMETRRGKDALARHGLRPVPLFPTDLRRRVELEVMISLAGVEAEILAGPASGFFGGGTDEDRAKDLTTSLIVAGNLSPERQEMLSGVENTPGPTDEDKAFDLAKRLNWERHQAMDAAGAHVAYLRQVTRQIVFTDVFVAVVAAVVPPLLEDNVMAYERAVALMSRALEMYDIASTERAAR